MIGFFGGTFDPIHFGHLQAALEITEQLALSALYFLPCHLPPHRESPQVLAVHRSHMVSLAIQTEKRFHLDQRELLHQQPSYTVDTLQSIRAEIGETMPLVFIMGMDAFSSLQKWHRWHTIFDLAHIVVAHRPYYTKQMPAWCLERLKEDVRYLHQQASGYVMVCDITPLAISATLIRKKIAAGSSVRYLLPEVVLNCINAQGFYKKSRFEHDETRRGCKTR